MTKLTNEKQNLKNEIKHGIELEKEIAEKKRNVLKTIEDIEKVTGENDSENEQNQRLSIQFERMHHNSEGMPQVFLNSFKKIYFIFKKGDELC